MSELIETLRQQAEEIAREGHNGWGNTMLAAADAIRELQRQNEALTKWRYVVEETLNIVGGKLEKAEAERDELQRQIQEREADARRWQWARDNLLSMSFQDGKYKSGRTSIQPYFDDVDSKYWDGVADRAIAKEQTP